MNEFRRLLFCLMALLPAAGRPAQAGVCNVTAAEPRHQFEFTLGYSPASPTLIGTATDRRFVMAAFGYGYRCWEGKRVALSYTASVMPAALVLQPAQFSPRPGGAQFVSPHTVYGFGVLPVGFSAEFGRKHRLHPFAETAGGVIASTEPIPVNGDRASGLNFLFYFGGGVQWNFGPKAAVSAGYRFLHISNAGTTDFNPGLDNNVLYLGYTLRR